MIRSRTKRSAGIAFDPVVSGFEPEATSGGEEIPALSSNGSAERSAPKVQREGHFCPSPPPGYYALISCIYC